MGGKLPNRMLKEGIRSSEPINALSDKAYRLYTNLIVSADDFGLMSWTRGWVKSNALPLLNWTLDEVAQYMAEIAEMKLVRLYEVNSRQLAAMEKWVQRRDSRFPKFPIPPWPMKGEGSHIIGGYIAPRAREPEDTPPETPPEKTAPKNGRAARAEVDGAFTEFWTAYPRKENKAAAEDAWRKLKPDEEMTAKMMAAVAVQKVTGCLLPGTTRDGRSTIPHASTWINRRRWEDGVAPVGAGVTHQLPRERLPGQ